MRTGEFKQATIRILYKRAGEHCTICKKITSKPHADPEKFHNLGEAAHIHGLSNLPNLRFNAGLSARELSHIDNGIWICLACHQVIDGDEESFNAILLRDLKREHEQLVVRLQEQGSGFLSALSENQRKITVLEDLILTKERLLTANQVIYDQELNKLKFELDALRNENEFLNAQKNAIKDDVLDLNEPLLNDALMNEDGIDRALAILDVGLLDKEEIRIAKSRLLRARLLTLKGDYDNAEKEYEHTFQFCPCTNVATAYVGFLYFFKLDFEKVIEIASFTQSRVDEPLAKAELLGQQAQALLKLERHEDARLLLIEARILLENNYPDKLWAVAVAAKFYKHIGDCYKLNLQYELALKSYESALNKYFIATLNSDDSATVYDFAGLATAIGLLYEQNNREEEAIIHHLRAVDVLQKTDYCKNNILSLIYLNVASCYLRHKTFDIKKATYYAGAAHRILVRLSKSSPRPNMEYLVGAKCLLADIYQISNVKAANRYYRQSLQLANILVLINPSFIKQKIQVLHNFAAFHFKKGKQRKALSYLEEGIGLFENNPSSLLDRTVGLTKSYLMKLNFAMTREEKIMLLNTIVEINKNTPRTEKTFAYKFMAEKMLAEM